MNAFTIILSLSINLSLASVDFTHSTLYDINDFVDNHEILISMCNNGCLIYASTMGSGFVDSPSDYDPYAEKLIIRDNILDQDIISVTDLSRKYEQTRQKTPLSFTGPASLSIVNLNSLKDTYWPIVVYVLENNKDVKFTFQMYDSLNLDSVTVAAGTTTIVSARLFSVSAKANAMPNSVTARLVGPDNVLDDNVDECAVAYSTNSQSTFSGFELNIAGPIISIAFSGAELTADIAFIPFADLSSDGFVTSGGWNGCKKPTTGGFQSFRSPFIQHSDIYTLNSDTDKYNVSIDVIPNLDDQHKVSVHDVIPNKMISVSGYTLEHIQFESTDFVNIVFNGLKGDQGFLLRYTTQALARTTTTAGMTSTSPSTSTSTTSTITPTTSSSYGIGGTLLFLLIAAVVAITLF